MTEPGREIHVRSAWPEDAPAVAALLGELGYQATAAELAARLRLLSATESDAVSLAFEGETPLGLIALHWTAMIHLERPLARITALVVAPRARRRNIGRRLLDHALELAERHGCGGIELTTALARTDAHDFYRANGFTSSSLRFYRPLWHAL